MNSKLFSWRGNILTVTILLSAPPAFAVPVQGFDSADQREYESGAGENEYLNHASVAFSSIRQAMMSTTLLGIRTFAERAMNAAIELQAVAMQRGDETLAGFAQGVYNNTKRAGMSLTVEQAHEYVESAMNYARKAQVLLGQAIEEQRHYESRVNYNQDREDPGVEVYGGRSHNRYSYQQQ